ERVLFLAAARTRPVAARLDRNAGREELSILADLEPHAACDFVLARLAIEFSAQLLAHAFVALHPRSPRTRKPILRAQFVEQRAANAQFAVGLEAHAALGIETLDRRNEPEVRSRFEISAIDAARQAHRESAHDLAHERLVFLDQTIAEFVVRSAAIAAPQ